MVSIEDVSEENIDDVFKLCSWDRAFAHNDDPLLERGREIRRRWLLDMLEQHGPCTKIAYLDGRPIAQIVFYPEEAIPYIDDPRNDARARTGTMAMVPFGPWVASMYLIPSTLTMLRTFRTSSGGTSPPGGATCGPPGGIGVGIVGSPLNPRGARAKNHN